MPPPAPRAPLPIDPALPEVLSRLSRSGALVLVAPPGSGKTTRLPPAVLEALPPGGTCLVIEPRRVAARAAAQRVAEERGCPVGAEVGYEVRFDRRVSPRTRLVFSTPGVLLARLRSDPFLEGTAAVLLDEFHERSLELDLAVALLRELRSVRADLWLAVLSATLEPAPVASYLGAETVEVPGRLFPVEVSYLPRLDADGPRGIPRRVAAAIRSAWAQRPGGRGDLLAFLPGAGEIRRTGEELADWAVEREVELLPLHGDLPLDAQTRVLRRDPSSRDRVILSTNVAETSVTVEGVVAVVDSGYARVLRHDAGTGLDRLDLSPISRAAAEQRSGRAGRLGPGRAYRLWTEHEHLSRPADDVPEVLRADLSTALLQIFAWGADPAAFAWFLRPPPESVTAGLALLRRLGAVDDAGRLSQRGAALSGLPLHPRLGRMLAEAASSGLLKEGAALAALASEKDVLLSGRALSSRSAPGVEASDSDLLDRLELLEEAERGGLAPERLRALGADPSALRAALRARDQLDRIGRAAFGEGPRPPSEERREALLRIVLAGYPDRVARRREGGSRRLVLVGGRGAVLAEGSSVLRPEFLVAVRLDAGRRGERSEAVVRWASGVRPEWLSAYAPAVRRRETRYDAGAERVLATERTFFEDLCVAERQVPPDPTDAARLLAAELGRHPASLLEPGSEAAEFVARCRFLARAMPEEGMPGWSAADWDETLGELCAGKTSVAEVRRSDLPEVLRSRLTWKQRETVERQAPARIQVPSGSRMRVEYPEDGPPVLAVRIQEVFGWAEGPRVAGNRVPVLLHLLGPHGRPLQVTSDLKSFWERTYPEIRKELRGRYPKHFWPDDPRRAPPRLLARHARSES